MSQVKLEPMDEFPIGVDDSKAVSPTKKKRTARDAILGTEATPLPPNVPREEPVLRAEIAEAAAVPLAGPQLAGPGLIYEDIGNANDYAGENNPFQLLFQRSQLVIEEWKRKLARAKDKCDDEKAQLERKFEAELDKHRRTREVELAEHKRKWDIRELEHENAQTKLRAKITELQTKLTTDKQQAEDKLARTVTEWEGRQNLWKLKTDATDGENARLKQEVKRAKEDQDECAKLKKQYVEALDKVYNDYLDADQQRRMGSRPNIGMSREALAGWQSLWSEKNSQTKMATDTLTYAALQERHHYVSRALVELASHHQTLHDFIRTLVTRVKEIRPPPLEHLNTADRVDYLTDIHGVNTYWTVLTMALDQLARDAALIPAETAEEFKIDWTRVSAATEPPDVKQLRTQLKLQRDVLDRLTKENVDLRDQLAANAKDLATSQVLVMRVNAIWSELKSAGLQRIYPDVDDLVALATQSLVERLKKREKAAGESKEFPGLAPLIGADKQTYTAKLQQTVERLTKELEAGRQRERDLTDEVRWYKSQEKEFLKQSRVCDQMKTWGAALSSSLWHSMTGAALDPDRILDQITRVQRDTVLHTQGEMVRVLYQWFTGTVQGNLASEDVFLALDQIFNEELDPSKTMAPPDDWVTDFGPTRGPLGQISKAQLEPQAGRISIEGPFSIYKYVRNEEWHAMADAYFQRLNRGDAIPNRRNAGSVPMAVDSAPEPAEAKEPSVSPATPVPNQVMAVPLSEEQRLEAEEQKAKEEAYQQKVAQFKEAWAMPRMEVVDWAVGSAEPTRIRKIRFQVYRAFAIHLRWMVWLASHTPSMADTDRWQNDTQAEVRKLSRAVEKQVTKYLEESEKKDADRTVAVIAAMRNITDLFRIEFSAFWLERQLLEASTGNSKDKELELKHRDTLQRIQYGIQAVWRARDWSDKYPAKPLARYAEDRFKELAKAWSDSEDQLESKIKEQTALLKTWTTQAGRTIRVVDLEPGDEAMLTPDTLTRVGDRVKVFKDELKEWSRVTGQMAKALNDFTRKLDDAKEPESKESNVQALEEVYLPRIQKVLREYVKWSDEANKAFANAIKNEYVAKNGASEFELVREPHQLSINMGHLLDRVAIKVQTMTQMSKLLQTRLLNGGGGGGPRPPRNASATTMGPVSLTRLNCKPRKELLRADPWRLAVFKTASGDAVLWKTPCQRVFEFLMHMAGKAACDLQDLVMAKYLEDQNGQSLHLVPIDPMEVVGTSQLGESANASLALATITNAVSEANLQQQKAKADLDEAIAALAERWNGDGFTERAKKGDNLDGIGTPKDYPDKIEEDLAEILSVGAHTAIVAALEFLRTNPRHAQASLLGLVSHRRYREPFAEFCAAEYKFRQLQNLATPARDRTPHDRAVVNQQLTAAQHALLS